MTDTERAWEIHPNSLISIAELPNCGRHNCRLKHRASQHHRCRRDGAGMHPSDRVYWRTNARNIYTPETMTGCAGSEPFALQVIGDSMEPEFVAGAIVIVEPTSSYHDGYFVVAAHDGDFLLRRLRIDDGHWWLDALNDTYPALAIPGPSSVRGRVIERTGKRRKDRKRYS